MNLRSAILAIAFGFACFGAASAIHQKLTGPVVTSALPIPLCNPDDPTCGLGGN